MDILLMLCLTAPIWIIPMFIGSIVEGSTIKAVLHIVILVLLVLCIFGRRWIPGVFDPKRNGELVYVDEDGEEEEKTSSNDWFVPGYEIKKTLYIMLLGLLVLCVCGRSWIPGIYYPAKIFVFEKAYRESSPLIISFVSGMDDFESSIYGETFTNKQYEVIHIKKMTYEWEGNTGEFLKNDENIKFRLRMIRSEIDGWYENDWPRSISLGKFNPEKLFKGKKVGNKFKLYLKVVYSFGDEPEETAILQYNVKVLKGEYRSIWYGIGA